MAIISPVKLHVLLLLLYGIPIIHQWSQGAPAHQASAGAWILGLYFVVGLFGILAILSSAIMFGRAGKKKLTLKGVLAIHLISAAVIFMFLKLISMVLS